jgi:DNA-directed RNA polymerase subunit M/transcription elongation factor TFIIS
MTFHRKPTGRKCSKCGYEMKVPPQGGTGGRGRFCPNCKEYKVRPYVKKGEVKSNKLRCTGCGAEFSGG